MDTFFVLMLLTPELCFGALSIDRFKYEINSTVGKLDFKYINNAKGNAVMNISAQTFHTITKVMIYFKVNIIIRKDGRDYMQEFMKTRIDAVKLLKGLHGNVFLKKFMGNFLPEITALNITIPLPPVSSLMKNCIQLFISEIFV